MFKEDGVEKICKWIKIAEQSESFDIETTSDWEKWVARPCIDMMLAPREARAVLEVVGYFANYGVKVSAIIEEIVKFVIDKHNKSINLKGEKTNDT